VLQKGETGPTRGGTKWSGWGQGMRGWGATSHGTCHLTTTCLQYTLLTPPGDPSLVTPPLPPLPTHPPSQPQA
jgi:hypothetical protein